MPAPRLRRRSARAAALFGGLVLAVAAAEVAVRVWPPAAGRARYESYFEDAARNRIEYTQARDRGLVVEPGLPRGRATWRPGTVFYMCYRGGRRPYMDARGCARVDINQLGLRDRPDLAWEKPPGVRRVVCLGDSFTFGWGVDEASTWVRRIEPGLRRRARGAAVATVNCGVAGTLYVDEYWWALRDRFGALGPDAVVVSVCLNDVALMPNTVALESPRAAEPNRHPLHLLRLLDQARRFRRRFDLDPGVDWGQLLLDLPPGDPWFAAKSESSDMFWPSGQPQAALRAMRDWCRERQAGFGVVVWPLFQNLGRDEHYPFHTLHRVVADFCRDERIAHLDLFETFHGQRVEDLWVDPSDMHGNEVAHALAAPAIEAFVGRLLGLGE
jgi:lysophospholipase L1-like esterase